MDDRAGGVATVNLSLSWLQRVGEGYLIDRGKVLRDPEGPLDDTLDPTTLELIEPDADKTTVYQGPCLLGPSLRSSSDAEGGQTIFRRYWKVRFPISAPRFKTGDVLVMEVSPDPRSSPQLVDQRFRLFDVDDRSLAATRIVLAEDEAGARARI